MKHKQLQPTLLLENDNWFWNGTKEFLNQFGEYCVYSPEIREKFFVKSVTMDFCMMLSQPIVERVVMVSSLASIVPLDNPNATDDSSDYLQIEYFSTFIRQIIQFREWVSHKPLEFHLIYGGPDFLEDLHHGCLGETTRENLYLIARQWPELFKVFVYEFGDDYFNYQYMLDETNLCPRN